MGFILILGLLFLCYLNVLGFQMLFDAIWYSQLISQKWPPVVVYLGSPNVVCLFIESLWEVADWLFHLVKPKSMRANLPMQRIAASPSLPLDICYCCRIVHPHEYCSALQQGLEHQQWLKSCPWTIFSSMRRSTDLEQIDQTTGSPNQTCPLLYKVQYNPGQG